MPKIRCSCKQLLAYREDQAGKTVKCPVCSGKIQLPKVPPPPKAPENVLRQQRIAAAAADLLAGPSSAKPGDADESESGIFITTQPPAPEGASQPQASTAMPKGDMKLDAADEDIPPDGNVPKWESDPPKSESA